MHAIHIAPVYSILIQILHIHNALPHRMSMKYIAPKHKTLLVQTGVCWQVGLACCERYDTQCTLSRTCHQLLTLLHISYHLICSKTTFYDHQGKTVGGRDVVKVSCTRLTTFPSLCFNCFFGYIHMNEKHLPNWSISVMIIKVFSIFILTLIASWLTRSRSVGSIKVCMSPWAGQFI